MTSSRRTKENYLKPLVKREGHKRHVVFDIESNAWTKFEMAGVYDGRSYERHDTVGSLVDSLLQRRFIDRIIFAHNGGRFDFLFIFDYLKKTNIEMKLICQGPRITAIKIKQGDRHYTTIQDSYSILSSSLDSLCKAFKPATAKLTGAIDFEKERVDKANPLHQEYLEADCISLWEIIEKYKHMPFIEDVGIKMTAASTAMSAWRTTLKSPIKRSPDYVQDFVRRAYAGGRCEIFRQIMGEGQCVDANSLYPTQMLKPMPCEVEYETHNADDFGFHDVTIEVPESYMPILWVKTPKLIFPTGTFRGTFFSEELKLAIEQGAKIQKHHRGIKFSSRTDLFTDYINKCYQLRLDNPDNAINMVAKLLMNSCYGKFAEREEKKTLLKINPLDVETWPKSFSHFHSEKMFEATGLVTVTERRRSPHMLVHIAAAITAYGRIEMAKNLYLPYQDKIHYTDTDSGFITSDIATGKGLGAFKKEYGIKKGFFLLPKGYWIETDDGKIIRKLKGFSKKTLNSITYEKFKKGNIKTTEKRLAGFRTALIRENQFLALIDQKKSVISEYSKRKILPGGETRPWHLKKGELV